MYTIQDLDKINRVTKVIVDTNAYYGTGFDFLGIKSLNIPLFMEALNNKNIGLLNHPILANELVANLDESKILSTLVSAQNTIRKYSSFITTNKILGILSLNNLIKYDFKKANIDKYKYFYSNSISLGYPRCDLIFDKWFRRTPPFSGKKKDEFPDAFVLQSLVDYIYANTGEIVLVISNDKDWESFLKYYDRVILCKNIQQATNFINHSNFYLNDKEIIEIINSLSKEIFVCFDEYVPFYDCYVNGFDEGEDVCIDSCEGHEIIGILPLKVSENEIIARIDIKMIVSGSARQLNYDLSCWDGEEKDYMIKHYDNISFKGESITSVEVHINYNKADFENNEVDGLKIIDDNNIVVDEIMDVAQY